MAKLIGYSLINLKTKTEVAWSKEFPLTFRDKRNKIKIDFDRVNLIAPDRKNPEYIVKERWQIDTIPDNHKLIGYKKARFNEPLDRVEVEGIYNAIPVVKNPKTFPVGYTLT